MLRADWIDTTTPVQLEIHRRNGCTHTGPAHVRDVKPSAQGCEECLKTGDSWVHLRMCMACGHVSCCDSSKNKHATQPFHATQHPVTRSMEPGEAWGYCYVDDVVLRG